MIMSILNSSRLNHIHNCFSFSLRSIFVFVFLTSSFILFLNGQNLNLNNDVIDFVPDLDFNCKSSLAFDEENKDTRASPSIKQQSNDTLQESRIFNNEISENSLDIRLKVKLTDYFLRSLLFENVKRIKQDQRKDQFQQLKKDSDYYQDSNSFPLKIKSLSSPTDLKGFYTNQPDIMANIEAEDSIHSLNGISNFIEIENINESFLKSLSNEFNENSISSRLRTGKKGDLKELSIKDYTYMVPITENFGDSTNAPVSKIIGFVKIEPVEIKEALVIPNVKSQERIQKEYVHFLKKKKEEEEKKRLEEEMRNKRRLEEEENLRQIEIEKLRIEEEKKRLSETNEMKREKGISFEYSVTFDDNKKPMGMNLDLVNEGLAVTRIETNSPADLKKVKAKDVIVAVNNQNLENISPNDRLKFLSKASWPRMLTFQTPSTRKKVLEPLYANLQILSPDVLRGNYKAQVASWSMSAFDNITTYSIFEPVDIVGCENLMENSKNQEKLKRLLIYEKKDFFVHSIRGGCSFFDKFKRAKEFGAKGLIVSNNVNELLDLPSGREILDSSRNFNSKEKLSDIPILSIDSFSGHLLSISSSFSNPINFRLISDKETALPFDICENNHIYTKEIKSETKERDVDENNENLNPDSAIEEELDLDEETRFQRKQEREKQKREIEREKLLKAEVEEINNITIPRTETDAGGKLLLRGKNMVDSLVFDFRSATFGAPTINLTTLHMYSSDQRMSAFTNEYLLHDSPISQEKQYNPQLLKQISKEKSKIKYEKMAINGTVGQLVFADPKHGCQADMYKVRIKGLIVAVERGSCAFSDKAIAAQEGGAIGIIIYNSIKNEGENLMRLMATPEESEKVKIPVVMASSRFKEATDTQLRFGGGDFIVKLFEEGELNVYEEESEEFKELLARKRQEYNLLKRAKGGTAFEQKSIKNKNSPIKKTSTSNAKFSKTRSQTKTVGSQPRKK